MHIAFFNYIRITMPYFSPFQLSIFLITSSFMFFALSFIFRYFLLY
jgi:hypothetical protein